MFNKTSEKIFAYWLVATVLVVGFVACPKTTRPEDGPEHASTPTATNLEEPQVSVEPVLHTFWAEGGEEPVEPGISLTYEDMSYRADAKNQSVAGPTPHWRLSFADKVIEAARYPVFFVNLEGVQRIGFWWVREEDLAENAPGLLHPKRYVEATPDGSGVFRIDLTENLDWRGNIVLLIIAPYATPDKTFTLRSIRAWLSNGKWTTPKTPLGGRTTLTESDGALLGFYFVTALAQFPFGTGVMNPVEKNGWSADMWHYIKKRGVETLQTCLEKTDINTAMRLLSVLGRTSPSPIAFLNEMVTALPQDQRGLLWKERPCLVVKEFEEGVAAAVVWNNAAKRKIEKPEVLPNKGMDGGPCLSIRYGAPAAQGEAMVAIPVRIPLEDRPVGIRVFMKPSKPDENLSFINAATYKTWNSGGWLGRYRQQGSTDGWNIYAREDNFYKSAANLSNKTTAELGEVVITNLLVPLVGVENELLIDRVELYLLE